jgi:diguanylate cyclase (GGDEF)-like protein
MIVDAFTRVHATMPLDTKPAETPNHVLTTIAHSHTARDGESSAIAVDAATNDGDELLSVYELARALAGHATIADAADIIQRHLARLVPSALCIFFIYDMKADELEARHVVGEEASQFVGMRIAAGQRISGWVASNRKTVVNSDAMLDLNDPRKRPTILLRSCLSTPLTCQGELIGALSLYSTQLNGFNDDHRRLVESVATHIGHTLLRARDLDNASHRDVLTGLPHIEQLERVINSINDTESANMPPHLLLVIQVLDLQEINGAHGRLAGDTALRHVVRQTQTALRLGDILFRNTGDDFVVFLSSAEPDTADRLANRIADLIARQTVAVSSTSSITVRVAVTKVLAPSGRTAIREVINLTRQRSTAADFSRDQRPVIH